MKDYKHLFCKYPITKNLTGWQFCPILESDIWVPNSPGVYAMAKKKKVIVYAGKSMNLSNRFNKGHHKILAALREGAVYLHYLPMEVDEDELAVYEVELINRLQPLINTYHTAA